MADDTPKDCGGHKCGHVTCVCRIKAEHDKKCRYRKAACLSIELACDPHGLQACPECDPCTCGAVERGAAVLPIL